MGNSHNAHNAQKIKSKISSLAVGLLPASLLVSAIAFLSAPSAAAQTAAAESNPNPSASASPAGGSNAADAVGTPTPEPTELPRPDVLNLKKASKTDQLLARDWLQLTLLKPDDLPGLKNVPDIADEPLRRRISESFGLPAIMTMKEPAVTPPEWWTAQSKGPEVLTLGPTRHFRRPDLVIEFPLLRLNEIPYLKGDSQTIRALNEVVRLWTLGRIDEALKLSGALQSEKKKLPQGSPERAAIAAVQGFLEIFEIPESDDRKRMMRRSLSFLWDAIGRTEVKSYMNVKGGNKLDDGMLKALLADPVLVGDEGLYPPKIAVPKLRARSMDVTGFLSSLSLPALYNIAALASKTQNWTRVYEASDRFNEIYALLDAGQARQEGQDLNFTTPPGVAASHPILMRPQSPHHLKILMRMLKVKAQFTAQDPLLALSETAKVILNSDVPAFKTLGFTLAGNIYDDLGYPQYARRFYAFAEAFAGVEWYQQNPYFILNGAENAFWSGDYALAKRGFEKFLLSAGDKTYGPWARLRLAEIIHLQSGPQRTVTRYEELLRSHSNHPAGLIARRRLFCISSSEMGARARRQEFLALKELSARYETDEMEQIRACRLTNLFDEAGQASSREIKTLPEEAKLQLGLIDEFKMMYPQSAYLKFFETRQTVLETALGPYLLAFKQCAPALDFYRKNVKKIEALKSNSGRYLQSLKWGDDERERLTRCAALFSSTETLSAIYKGTTAGSVKKSRARKVAAEPVKRFETSEQKLIRLTIEMIMAPSDQMAARLLSEIRQRGQTVLMDDVVRLEEQKSKSVDDPSFWLKLATLKVTQWDLEQPSSKKPQLNRLMRAEVLRFPDRTLNSPEFCQRLLAESSTLNRQEWDSFVLALPTSRWLALLDEGKNQCSNQIAFEALKTAQSVPSLRRDRHLLWPWLQARGVLKEQEAWLALGQRWSRQKMVPKTELESLFKVLEEQADNELVKQAARAWRESQKPSSLW